MKMRECKVERKACRRHQLGVAAPWLALVLLVLAWQAWRLGRRAVAAWLVALPLLLVVLGLVQVWLRLPLPLVLVHNTAAALLLALLSGVGLDGPPDRNRTCI